MDTERQELEKKTRRIFHEIHLAQGEDAKIYDRLQSLLNTDYLNEKKDFFVGKICLDAGCGSNANATLAMLKMGAKKVYAFDLDETIFEKIPKYLFDFKDRYELSCGNVLNTKYPKDFFDFTYCAGVLHHTDDPIGGIRELCRVTKTGGVLCIMINGSGGLVREVTNFLRDKYLKDNEFKRLIDGLSARHFIEMWLWLIKSMKEKGDTMGEDIPPSLIEQLFDNDLVLTIKDRITAPVYHEFTQRRLVELLQENGFSDIERISRYPKMNNIRRFLCPFYEKFDHKFSRILYGEGMIQMKAKKLK